MATMQGVAWCCGCRNELPMVQEEETWYCPDCLAVKDRFDRLVRSVLFFGEALADEGHDPKEIRDALEEACRQFKT
jgi:hypothetical protein